MNNEINPLEFLLTNIPIIRKQIESLVEQQKRIRKKIAEIEHNSKSQRGYDKQKVTETYYIN